MSLGGRKNFLVHVCINMLYISPLSVMSLSEKMLITERREGGRDLLAHIYKQIRNCDVYITVMPQSYDNRLQ